MLHTAVVIATTGRPKIAAETLKRIVERQTILPDLILVSCVKAEDFEFLSDIENVIVLKGRRGLAAQRNAALMALPDFIDVVVFFDDDFVPAPDWLEVVSNLFSKEPEIVGITGDVIADGIKGPGLNFEDVDQILDGVSVMETNRVIKNFSPYGCNMAFRRSAIGMLRFDERLVLYGWLEDRDFRRSISCEGRAAGEDLQARGVHMGVKSGRIAGDRLGYSQIVNPLYLASKGQ